MQFLLEETGDDGESSYVAVPLSLSPSLSPSLPSVPSLHQAFSTYKQLSATQGKGNGTSLTQHSFKPVPAALTEDVSFDVKMEQLHGRKLCCLTVSMEKGELTVTKQGESGGTTYKHSQGK